MASSSSSESTSCSSSKTASSSSSKNLEDLISNLAIAVKKKDSSSVPKNYKGRCFGEYWCPICPRLWMSANAWRGFEQNCTKCRTPIYARRYTRLEKPEGLDKSNPAKVHPQKLCGKCNSLGHCCRALSD